VDGGFQLTAVTPGSMLSRLGLQNGDIMKRVNGIPFDGLDGAIAISASARDAGVAVVDLERDGGPLRLTWTRELVGP
jgi:general secretion pathway protein C